MVDRENLKKLGWSDELIEAFGERAEALDWPDLPESLGPIESPKPKSRASTSFALSCEQSLSDSKFTIED